MSVLEAKETGNQTQSTIADQTARLIDALASKQFQQVEQRVIRQLLQTLIYEDVLPYEFRQDATPDNKGWFVLEGKTLDGKPVHYHCRGGAKVSFGQIKLEKVAVLRISENGQTRSATLQDTLTEVIARIPESELLATFMDELEQTLLKDLQSQTQERLTQPWNGQLDFDELEGDILDAHSYHPCYKSRIGFSLQQNEQYGPEFKNSMQLHWLAVHHPLGLMNHSMSTDYQEMIREQLGEQDFQRFAALLKAQGRNIENFWLLPVHPWQWEEKVLATFYPELVNKDIIYLGTGSDHYRAQQSIRTLANASVKEKPYAKLALSITNTSTSRILAGHTVLNGPIITDWLHGLVAQDETAKEMDFVILGETLGVTFNYQQLPDVRKTKAYGTLGVIWRESLHRYLREGEEGFPFNGLCSYIPEQSNTSGQTSSDPVPLIDAWIKQYGVKAWTEQLLKVSISPIIHMLFAQGIGMESHAQNIVLIHKNGWPVRIALKDLHDGVRYSPSHLAYPEKNPDLYPVPPSHAEINPNSFILTDDLDAVRDFSCDAFFFICLAELCIFLEQQYQLEETKFWRMAANVILDYQKSYPEHAERYKAFDVFAETYQVEELTKRRLFGDHQPRFKKVPNPLYAHKPKTR
ncbi:IucA/IucC family protein [Hahella ganghwensis]|uniref:IucA/IucC family protein n=1 Tax=Hahella ganghwensis TaxID=286420 RepID=UPI0003739890|nr:IucA/IucC family protein [Hahella ganghwensis]